MPHRAQKRSRRQAKRAGRQAQREAEASGSSRSEARAAGLAAKRSRRDTDDPEGAESREAGRARRRELRAGGATRRRAKVGARKTRNRTQSRLDANATDPTPPLFPGLFPDIDRQGNSDPTTALPIDPLPGEVGEDPGQEAIDPLNFLLSRKLRAALQNFGGQFDPLGHRGGNADRLRSLVGGLLSNNLSGGAGDLFGRIQGGALPQDRRLRLASPKLRALLSRFGGQLSGDDRSFIESILAVSPRGDEGPLFIHPTRGPQRTGGRNLPRNFVSEPPPQRRNRGGGGGGNGGGGGGNTGGGGGGGGNGGGGNGGGGGGGNGGGIDQDAATLFSDPSARFILRGNRQFGDFGSSAPTFEELLRKSQNQFSGGNLLSQF